jgi:hypothetical protein
LTDCARFKAVLQLAPIDLLPVETRGIRDICTVEFASNVGIRSASFSFGFMEVISPWVATLDAGDSDGLGV